MWHFLRSRERRRGEAVDLVVDAMRLAFGDSLASGRLARAMRSDDYVCGYVVARLHALVDGACRRTRADARREEIFDQAARRFFGADHAALRSRVARPANAGTCAAWVEGTRDGQAQSDYLFGRRDVREHPAFAEAVAIERASAALFPRNRCNGSDAAIAQHIEMLTFGGYLRSRHPT